MVISSLENMSGVNKYEALITSDDSEADDANGAEKQQKNEPRNIEVGTDEHRLQSTYCLWYSRKPGKSMAHHQSFDQNLRLVGQFASIEQFWKLYSHLQRPGEIQPQFDFHLFKQGIKPMWEDEANRYGGKWIVRLRKGLSSRCWENVVLAMLGEQFMVGDEICGTVVSIRNHEDIISIWNRSANDNAITNRIRDTFRRVLNLPGGTVIEYKAHNDSIKYVKDHSSFRTNTESFLR